MAIREVVRFECDEKGCKDLPAMTYTQAVTHVETHLRLDNANTLRELETLWRI